MKKVTLTVLLFLFALSAASAGGALDTLLQPTGNPPAREAQPPETPVPSPTPAPTPATQPAPAATPAPAAQQIGPDDLEYTLIDDGTAYSVSARGEEMIKGAVVIPSSFNGRPVTTVRWFGYQTEITSITIPSSVTTIGNRAFDMCESLTSVTFAEGSRLQTIGQGAFDNCTGITSITIPAGVTSMGESAFTWWTASQTIIIQGFTGQAEAGTVWRTPWSYLSSARIVYAGTSDIF